MHRQPIGGAATLLVALQDAATTTWDSGCLREQGTQELELIGKLHCEGWAPGLSKVRAGAVVCNACTIGWCTCMPDRFHTTYQSALCSQRSKI